MAAALIAPAREGVLEFDEISEAVNRIANDSPELIAPVRGHAAAASTAAEKPATPARRKKNDDQPSLFDTERSD
jgi:hypothetical protein